jgi:hypothetical protein
MRFHQSQYHQPFYHCPLSIVATDHDFETWLRI